MAEWGLAKPYFERCYIVGLPTQCWLWTGTVRIDGYGYFKLSGKRILAHRLAWLYANPEEALKPEECICHYCDAKLCVNPEHLYKGDDKTNAYDRYKIGIWS